ncbi:hypothetical protein [Thauera aromatica]|uniref:hypothetical protein n=1 Tax=Thauera aromatica TaxID=59405 RepID=UPI001FFD24F6|nr:hypothetical protein [Thauera aromatica]MCK2097510.1 hypothetical protein [Thauera aromatica]
MKYLYIHAGLPKTGSSALQVFFSQNVNNLRSCGIEYFELENLSIAEAGGITSGNGALLSRWFLPQTHPEHYSDGHPIYENLLQLTKNCNCDIGLVSSEFFSNIPLERIKQIKDDFSALGVTVKFIYYVRRQDQYLVSAYLQQVKRHGCTSTVTEYVKQSYKNIHFLNYYSYTRDLEELLGISNVAPYIYEETKYYPHGLAGHFIKSIAGICPDWITKIPVVNTSPSISEIKMILLANRFKPRFEFSDMLIEDSVLCTRSQAYKQHSIVSNEIAFEILEYFRDENKNFEDSYCSGSRFPDYTPVTHASLDEYNFNADEVMDIISGFLVRYDIRLSELETLIRKMRVNIGHLE